MKKQSAQDFAVIHQHVLRAKADNSLKDESQAFYHVLLETLFDLQDDEIDAAITDDHYRVGNAWLRYASYHLLFALRLLAERESLELEFSQLDAIWKLYPKAKSAIRAARNIAKKQQGEEFEDVLFFKSSLAKSLTEDSIGNKTVSATPRRFAPKH